MMRPPARRRRPCGRARVRLALLVVGLVLSLPGAAAAGDAGLLLEIDTAHFVLRARDLRDGALGPELRVALGSPAHPTPRGRFRAHRVVREPGWWPGPRARRAGARPLAPGPDGPLGIAKIPFAGGGAISIHGGAHPLVLGKPISLGCVRMADADLARLLQWLDERAALGVVHAAPSGARVQALRRPLRVVVD